MSELSLLLKVVCELLRTIWRYLFLYEPTRFRRCRTRQGTLWGALASTSRGPRDFAQSVFLNHFFGNVRADPF